MRLELNKREIFIVKWALFQAYFSLGKTCSLQLFWRLSLLFCWLSYFYLWN